MQRVERAAGEPPFSIALMSLQMAVEREEIRRKGKFDSRSISAVREVLDTIDEGSALEGLARIAMLIGKASSGLAKSGNSCR